MPRRTRNRPHRSPARRRPPLGQHFLSDERLRHQILDELNAGPEDCWLEIGAGHGEMTLALAQTGAIVVAIERDPALASSLQEQLAGFPRARLFTADILDVSLAALGRELNCPHWRVYGNLPYYITSPILQHLFASAGLIADIHVVVQREVAERLVAQPKSRDYGYLSVLTQLHADAEILRTIPPGAFRPPPKVESALVRLVPPGPGAELGLEDTKAFLRFVGVCFRHKRKTLFNNLRGLYERDRVQEALVSSGLDARVRAEEVSIETFAALHRVLRTS